MAPSGAHVLVPKALRLFRYAINKTATLIRAQLPHSSAAERVILEAIPVRATNQPLHPVAALRHRIAQHQQSRNFTTFRTLITGTTPKVLRSNLPVSNVSRTLVQQHRAPFASTLRPNLTGGALPRSAGGYSLGGRVRHFSHTGSAQAQVFGNVTAGMRAFVLSGARARFDGVDKKGGKKWRIVKNEKEGMSKTFLGQKMVGKGKKQRGTSLEFRLAPAITVVTEGVNLNTPNVLPQLAGDFARALKAMAAVHADLRRLSYLGDLPVYMKNQSTLVVRFHGCDAAAVTALCDEVGVTRGVVREDEAWQTDKEVEMALLFPFAPSRGESESEMFSDCAFDDGVGYMYSTHVKPERLDWINMLPSPMSEAHTESPHFSTKSTISGDGFSQIPSSWTAEGDGTESGSEEDYVSSRVATSEQSGSAAYEGVEGIYRFIAECDSVLR